MLASASALAASPVIERSWQDAVEVAARQVLEAKAEQAGWLEPRFEIVVLDGAAGRRAAAPVSCAQVARVEPIETRHVMRMRFAVACDAAPTWQRDVVVRAKVMARVVVMAADVRAGQAIADSDLALEPREVTAIPDAVSDTDGAVGLTSKRSLQLGQVLTQHVLLTPLLVARGQSVAIQARSGGVSVSMAGEALDAGRLRDVIRVRNSASGKVIRARVIDSGMVEPESMAAAPAQSRR